jgi:hypothetical protein
MIARIAGFVVLFIGAAVCLGESAEFLPPMDNLYDNRLQVECSDYLSVNLYNVPIDPKWAADASHFTIVSADDPAYAETKAVHPLEAGSRNRAVRVAERKTLLVKQAAIFLHLPTPMINGHAYRVIFNDGPADLPVLAPVAYDDSRQINDDIRLNQLGYLPAYAKHAYIGQYMGSLGSMPISGPSFELRGTDGKTAFTGPIARRGTGDDLVGQTVYDLDFSAFKGEGTFQIHVPGVGLSYPFEIGAGALNPLYANYMRGHYQQRCGMAIDPAYDRHARPACHLDDAYLDAAVLKLGFVKPKSLPFYPTDYDGKIHSAIHGHHDAGDYGKYTSTGAAYVFDCLNAMAVFPDKFKEDDLGMPYSGNGIPDLVDECKWELDWLENMQDDSDGGVFGVIKPPNGGYETGLPAVEGHRLLYPKDTVFTAAFAGALARASRSAVMRKYYPADCDRYLKKAIKAWAFLEKNNNYIDYFGYGETFGDWDERCYASVELYAATGEDKYHKYFLANFDPTRKMWGWVPMVEFVGSSVDTYVFLDNRPRDPDMLKRCKDVLREACNTYVADSDADPYRLSLPKAVISSGRYGWMFPGDFAGYNLLMGYAMDHDPRYLQCALNNMSYTCGANASGYFLMTGIGSKRNIEVVSNHTNSDIIEPVPGKPLGIGSSDMYYLNQYGKQLAADQYPPQFPLMNRWYDGFNVQTEFTMGPMMRETIVAAYFSDIAKHPHPRPSVKIVADHATGVSPVTVHFSIATQTPGGGHVREVFWDFGDESFSTSASPVHTFYGKTREYPVAVTITDEDGLTAYDTAYIRCAAADAPFPRSANKPDANTLALFHLDGNLDDSSGRDLHLAVVSPPSVRSLVPYHFAERPPLWMKNPAGSCLVLKGAEQFTVTIPDSELPTPATTPWKLEMMVYVESFAGWGFPGNPVLLGMRNDGDSMIGWYQDTWSRAMAPKFFDAVPAQKFAADFPRNQWSHVEIAYDGRDTARFYVDGKLWGTQTGSLIAASKKPPMTLTVGPFVGMVDEIRLSRGN